MKTKKNAEEVMAAVKPDRRLLSNVPDSEGIRANPDRRGQNKLKGRDRKADAGYTEKLRALSLRYSADFDVMLTEEGAGKGKKIKGRSVDLSASGMLVELDDESVGIETCQVYRIKFFLPSGLMPEGFESKVDIRARAVRI